MGSPTRILPGLLVLTVLFLSSCVPGEYRIGYLAGLSGTYSPLGIEGRRALELAAAQVNGAGGIGGHPVRLVAMDDQGAPDLALDGLKSLEKQQVRLVIGPMTSGEMDQIWPYLNSRHILFLSPTVAAQKFSSQDDYFYRLGVSTDQIGAFLAQMAVRQGVRTLSAVVERSNGNYTREVLGSFRSAGDPGGIRLAGVVEFDGRLDKDPGQILSKLPLGGSDGFLFLMNGFDAALFTQKLAQAGRMQPVFLPPWAMTRELVDLGGRQVSRIFLAGLLDPDSTRAPYLEFRDRYRSLYSAEPDYPAVFSWEAFTVAVKLLGQVPGDANGEALKKVLDSQKNWGGLQSDLGFDDRGNAVRELYPLRIQNGQFVRMAP